MTEGQAKQKWCPFSRAPLTTHTEDGVIGNRMADGQPSTRNMCLGSGCMAWAGDGCGLVQQPADIPRGGVR